MSFGSVNIKYMRCQNLILSLGPKCIVTPLASGGYIDPDLFPVHATDFYVTIVRHNIDHADLQ